MGQVKCLRPAAGLSFTLSLLLHNLAHPPWVSSCSLNKRQHLRVRSQTLACAPDIHVDVRVPHAKLSSSTSQICAGLEK